MLSRDKRNYLSSINSVDTRKWKLGIDIVTDERSHHCNEFKVVRNAVSESYGIIRDINIEWIPVDVVMIDAE